MADASVASSSSLFSNKRKQRVVCISSSEEEEEEEDDDDEGSDDNDEEEESSVSEEESESEDETDEEDPAASDEESESSADDDGDYDSGDDDGDYYDDDGDDDDDDDNDSKGKPTDDEHCNKVIDLLLGRKSLNSLKLEECKAYLRKHELRISGNKETCIERILEHWRIKDGNGEKLYPKSSFVINCTGDVCRADVVMFKQRIYEKFDIVKRGGGAKILGKRIIAGRVVRESYGGVKQQHTFSIEVLWSKGVKPLPSLYPLLVKGRNLYRLKTFRQPWSNEAERSRVLAEKHNRGAAARHVRAISRTMAATKGRKRKKKSSTTKAPPSKKWKKDLELATGKKKQNCDKKLFNGYANTKKVVKTSNPGSFATRGQAKTQGAAKARNSRLSATHGHAKKRDAAKTNNLGSSATRGKAKTQAAAKARNSQLSATHGHAKMRDAAKTNNLGSSATRGQAKTQAAAKARNSQSSAHAKTREVVKTRNTKSSATHSEQHSYHPNGIRGGYPYPQRYSYYNYNQTPTEVLRSNNIGMPQANRETHHMPSYGMGYTSSAAGVPHGHILQSHNMGYPLSVHGQIPNSASYYYDSRPYGNPAFLLDPRR